MKWSPKEVWTVPLTQWKQRDPQMGGSGAVVYCTFNTVEKKSPTDVVVVL